ncbi:MAG: hypothetical protein ACLUTE_09260 [Dorea longicatena]
MVLIAGMGMACRIQSLESRNKRWAENTETAGKILTESGKKEAQKQTDGTENDAAAQNAKRVFGDEPAELYARSAVLMDADSGRVLFGKDADVVRPMASTTKIMTCILALEYLRRTSGSDDRSIGSGCVPAEGTSWDAERGSVLHQRPVVFPDAGIA